MWHQTEDSKFSHLQTCKFETTNNYMAIICIIYKLYSVD